MKAWSAWIIPLDKDLLQELSQISWFTFPKCYIHWCPGIPRCIYNLSKCNSQIKKHILLIKNPSPYKIFHYYKTIVQCCAKPIWFVTPLPNTLQKTVSNHIPRSRDMEKNQESLFHYIHIYQMKYHSCRCGYCSMSWGLKRLHAGTANSLERLQCRCYIYYHCCYCCVNYISNQFNIIWHCPVIAFR